MMTIAELSRIDRTIEIKAAAERVYRALTDPVELGAWFQMKIEGEIAPGNEIFMTPTHRDDVLAFGVLIVELIPPTRVVWQWHPGEVDPGVDRSAEPRTTVTFTLEAITAGTRLTLEETGFDEVSLQFRAKAYADNTQGWNEVLVWLQKYVEAAG